MNIVAVDRPRDETQSSDSNKRRCDTTVTIMQNTTPEMVAFLPDDPENPYNWPTVPNLTPPPFHTHTHARISFG